MLTGSHDDREENSDYINVDPDAATGTNIISTATELHLQ